MASAVDESNQVEDSGSKPKCIYPGPNPNVKYPLSVLYCGGKYLFLIRRIQIVTKF